MSLLPKEGYRRVLVLAAYGALALGVGYLFLRYLLKPFLPFFLAWIIAMAVALVYQNRAPDLCDAMDRGDFTL